jgi:FkbM family methyltransferase
VALCGTPNVAAWRRHLDGSDFFAWHTRNELGALNAVEIAGLHLLNRPGFRGVLGRAVSTYVTLKNLKRCVVFYDRAWVHRYSDGVLVEPLPRYRVTLSQLQTQVVDLWMYHYIPKMGDNVVDIGAGTGWETLFFSRYVGPSGRVISIEAHPETFFYLQETCRRNQLANVVLSNRAVTDSRAEVLISDLSETAAGSAGGIANSILANGPGIPVHGQTLDEIVPAFGLSKVDLLKMNIEGAEGLAIHGMKEVIRKTRLLVIISCHDFKADRQTGPEQMRTRAPVVGFLKKWLRDLHARV